MGFAVLGVASKNTWKQRLLKVGTIVICTAVVFGVFLKVIEKKRFNDEVAARGAAEITGSVSPSAMQFGPSGLPLPRFVSLKSAKVNVRKGPSSDHGVAWVFQRKGMPVEIVAEFENWRRIRDNEGQEGWILQQMLSGKRYAVVMGYGNSAGIPMYEDADANSETIATLMTGVTAEVSSCDGEWCQVSAGGYDGYVGQVRVWGVYPQELVD